MPTPAVSILVASYNYEQYLGSALQSILDQTWQDFEVLVIDDGSQDASVALAESFAAQDSRVRVLRHPDGKNHGLPATLELGIAQALGQYIAFLESDDIWKAECLTHRFEALQEHTVGAVFNAVEALSMPGADTRWFDGYVPRILKEHSERSVGHNGKGNASFSLATVLLVENKIPTFSCIMVKKDLLATCHFGSPVPRWLDWWLWVQIAQQTSFTFVQAKDTFWRLHKGSFNHRISFPRYLADGAAIWNGFRNQLKQPTQQTLSKKARLFLLCPFWLRLVVRFFMIGKEYGLRGICSRIKTRLQR